MMRHPPPFVLLAAFSAGAHAAALALVGRHGSSLDTRPPVSDSRPAQSALAGDTLDIEPAPSMSVAEEVNPAAKTESASKPSIAATRNTPRVPRSGATDRAQGGPVEAVAAQLFGAVGVRYAADLASAFAHAFPQAASADRVWDEAPFGSGGSADLDITIDETGHIVDTEIAGAPSVALRRGVERTLALLLPRAFTSAGAHTRVRVTARVTRDDVHDGLHGDVFALSGGSFAGRIGTAFFALPSGKGPGRRVDVELVLMP